LSLCAAAAVRRDLDRARIVLGDEEERLAGDRRRAMTTHLIWLSTMVDSGVPVLSLAARVLSQEATAFAANGERVRRLELVAAIEAFLRAARPIECWISPGTIRELGNHVPWLVDGLASPPGPSLHVRVVAEPDRARVAATAYRRTRALLWGTLPLLAPRQVASDR
jgi:hypothetical protein